MNFDQRMAGWHVLIVEDHRDTVELMRSLMELYGCTVSTALNGKEGLEAVRLQKPRFIIADINMPVMNGWEMIDHLQDDEETASVPVIVLSAHASYNDHRSIRAKNYPRIIHKPIVPENFFNQVVNLLTNDFPELAR